MKNLFKSIVIIFFFGMPFQLSGQTETPMAENFAGGNGTKEDPYQISNLSEWRRFAGNAGTWDSYFVLTADIDATETNTWKTWGANPNIVSGINPVGWPGDPFTGNLNGNKHTVSNLYIKRDGAGYIAIFGSTKNADIHDIIFDSAYVEAFCNSGGLIGKSLGNDTISHVALTNLHFVGTENMSSNKGALNVGGLIAYSEGDTTVISGCIVTGKIDVNAEANGALVGLGNKLRISDCFTDVTMDIALASQSNSYNIAGLVSKASFCKISNSFSMCDFDYLGIDPLPCAFMGDNVKVGGEYTSITEDSYYNTDLLAEQTSAIGNDSDPAGISGLTSAEFRSSSKFPTFDFDTVWAMSVWGESSMPVLQWFEAEATEDVIISIRNSINEEITVKVYPTVLQPNENINIEFISDNPEHIKIELFNLFGQILLSKVIENPVNHVLPALDRASSGTVILVISDEQGQIIHTQKLIIN